MSAYWAHSPRIEEGIPAQSYAEHVENVRRNAETYAKEAGGYSAKLGPLLFQTAGLAAEYHDLGKLDRENQSVLACGTGVLPINHVDAGAAYLLQADSAPNAFAALLVYAHHRGLPSLPGERAKGRNFLRDEQLRHLTDERLQDYACAHAALISSRSSTSAQIPKPGITPLLTRMGLSCLVDADHSDTARHYGHPPPQTSPPLHATAIARLQKLDKYVTELAASKAEARSKLRSAVYEACRAAPTAPSMYACDSPVGTGKTTAVMAHLLQVVAAKGLRRVLVVLPYTNIIDQSVEVYRSSLTLPGENPADIVAAHHHRLEFEDRRSRHYAFLWHAPVIVTTAVQFFETLASNQPAALRKLHQVAGSAIFVDEAHAALPPCLWPQAWKWLRELVEAWGCHIVLGSGSLSRFWELGDFVQPPVRLPELVTDPLRTKATGAELDRITYRSEQDAMDLKGLTSWIARFRGPRLVILNTVQSAAAVAQALVEEFDRSRVEHLSTALCPSHRAKTLNRVRERLSKRGDENWTLVATSCVEAGVDLSFRTCMRERCGLIHLIQTGGRGNRSGEYGQTEVWDFQLVYGEDLREHPAFRTSARILAELFAEEKVDPQHCTEALRREIRQEGMRDIANAIEVAERNQEFPNVEGQFRVIESNTVTAIVDGKIRARVERGAKVSPQELQEGSVQIWAYQKDAWGLAESPRYPGLFFWTLAYDDFLGYMKGVLEVSRFRKGLVGPL